MYLFPGENEVLLEDRVIGIFDLDTCSASRRTREYLRQAEAAGEIVDFSGHLPESFLLCDHPYHDQILYLSRLKPKTILNRRDPWEA